MKRLIKTELDRELAIGQLKRLDLTSERSFLFSCEEQKKNRTAPQNKLYRLWLTCISQETGNEVDDLHDYFKEKYLEPDIHMVLGREVKRYTTTNKNTIQFTNYLEKIRIEADRDLSIRLPLPEDQYWHQFYDFYVDKL
jgi:hypothetical protein